MHAYVTGILKSHHGILDTLLFDTKDFISVIINGFIENISMLNGIKPLE